MNKLMLWLALCCAAPAWATADAVNTRADTAWVAGRVVRLDAARHKITLAHAPIPSLKMAAMTMPFHMDNTAPWSALKVGDKVRFTVREDNGTLTVQQVEVSP